MNFYKILFGIFLVVMAVLVLRNIMPMASILKIFIRTGRFPKVSIKKLDGTVTGKCPECGEKVEFIESEKNVYLYKCDSCGSKSKAYE